MSDKAHLNGLNYCIVTGSDCVIRLERRIRLKPQVDFGINMFHRIRNKALLPYKGVVRTIARGRTELYKPLSTEKQQIRVLDLDEPKLDDNGTIQGSLRTVSLRDNPSFQALSYHWGVSLAERPVRINNTDLQVTSNLHSALQHLRQSKERICVWIDAICINQEDVEERNQQVQLMPKIYRLADRVTIWLGPSGDDSDYAMEIAQLWEREHLQEKNHWNLIDKLRAGEFDERAWIAIRKFLARPYWTRSWVYQEILLAKAAIVKCGHKEMDWSCIQGIDETRYQLSRKMDIFKMELPPERLTMIQDANMECLMLFFNFSAGLSDKPASKLFQMLKWTASLSCSDPRDKIYSILGPAEDAKQYPPPDYSSGVVDVYTDFAHRQMLLDNHLSVLHEAGCRPGSPTIYGSENPIPSWVPKWTIPPENHMPYHNRSIYLGASAGIDVNMSSVIAASRSSLQVEGVLIDTISRVSKLDVPTLTIPDAIAFIENVDHKYNDDDYRNVTSYHHVHPTGLSLANVLFRTCLLNIDLRFLTRLDLDWDPYREDSVILARELLHGFMLRLVMDFGFVAFKNTTEEEKSDLRIPPFDLDFEFLPIGSRAATQLPHLTTFQKYLQYLQQESNEKDATKQPSAFWQLLNMGLFERHMGELIKGRKLFVTDKGYIGLTTNDEVKPGDMLVVLFGCDTPVVLRPIESDTSQGRAKTYHFISDVFVHGLMDGEAVQGVNVIADGDRYKYFAQETNNKVVMSDVRCFIIE